MIVDKLCMQEGALESHLGGERLGRIDLYPSHLWCSGDVIVAVFSRGLSGEYRVFY